MSCPVSSTPRLAAALPLSLPPLLRHVLTSQCDWHALVAPVYPSEARGALNRPQPLLVCGPFSVALPSRLLRRLHGSCARHSDSAVPRTSQEAGGRPWLPSQHRAGWSWSQLHFASIRRRPIYPPRLRPPGPPYCEHLQRLELDAMRGTRALRAALPAESHTWPSRGYPPLPGPPSAWVQRLKSGVPPGGLIWVEAGLTSPPGLG